MNKNQREYIGVIDSGVGGLHILKKIYSAYSNQNFIYYLDNLNMPYGNKTKAQLLDILIHNINFLIKKYNVYIVVLACNTATCSCLYDLQQIFDIPILGVRPTDFIEDNVDYILCTALTKNNIEKSLHSKVIVKSELANDIEKVFFEQKKLNDLIRKEFIEFKNKAIVLGCTHYQLIIENIKKQIKPINLIDPSERIIFDISRYISTNDKNLKKGKLKFYLSKDIEAIRKIKTYLEV